MTTTITADSNNDFTSELQDNFCTILNGINYNNASLGAVLDQLGIEYSENEITDELEDSDIVESYEVDTQEIARACAQARQSVIAQCHGFYASWDGDEDEALDSLIENFNKGEEATHWQEEIIREYAENR